MACPFIEQFVAIRRYVCNELRRLDRKQGRLLFQVSRLHDALEARGETLEQIPARQRRQEDNGTRTLRYQYFALQREERQLREARFRLAENILEWSETVERHDWETLRAVNLFDGLSEKFNEQWNEVQFTSRFLERTYSHNSRARGFLWNFPLA